MRIALLDDYQNVARELAPWHQLPDNAELSVFHDHVDDQGALVERLSPFDVIGVMRERTPFPRGLIEQLPRLRLLVTTGGKNAAIDVAAAQAQGICVCGTESRGFATAELTMALMLALSRNLIAEQRSVAEGGWQVGLGRDLRGATLGLLGLGRLGSEVAGMARAFGMRVIAWSENLTAEHAASHAVEAVSRDALLERADYVSIHLRLSARTAGLLGAGDFLRMPAHAALINTSRAPIVDTAALITALDEGQISAAALDVFDEEPLAANSPLRRHPKLLLTPHIGYVTRASYDVFYKGTLDAILAFVQGNPIRQMSA